MSVLENVINCVAVKYVGQSLCNFFISLSFNFVIIDDIIDFNNFSPFCFVINCSKQICFNNVCNSNDNESYIIKMTSC